MELTLTVICPEILVNPMVRDVNLNINAVIPCLMTEIVICICCHTCACFFEFTSFALDYTFNNYILIILLKCLI